MEINTIASVLVGLFDAEAAVGLALLALVIVVSSTGFSTRTTTPARTRDDRRLR